MRWNFLNEQSSSILCLRSISSLLKLIMSMVLPREVLLKRKAQYGWPSCINLFKLAPFYFENIIYLFYETSYLNKEVNYTEYPSVSIPWFWLKFRSVRSSKSFFLFCFLADLKYSWGSPAGAKFFHPLQGILTEGKGSVPSNSSLS